MRVHDDLRAPPAPHRELRDELAAVVREPRLVRDPLPSLALGARARSSRPVLQLDVQVRRADGAWRLEAAARRELPLPPRTAAKAAAHGDVADQSTR